MTRIRYALDLNWWTRISFRGRLFLFFSTRKDDELAAKRIIIPFISVYYSNYKVFGSWI